MPERIQRKRVKGWRMPPGAVYVGRPTKWGNPYREPGQDGEGLPWHAGDAAEAFRQWIALTTEGQWLAHDARQELRGKDLACWCPLDQPCRADVLLELANREPPS